MKKDKKPSDWKSGGGASPFSIIILMLILIITAVFCFTEFTRRSSYCSRCHSMKPYYESWKSSSHSRVECVKCHYSGAGSAWNSRFVGFRMLVKNAVSNFKGKRPWAEVADASCKRSNCHSADSLPEMVSLKGVEFKHVDHLNSPRRGKNLTCSSCHSELVHYAVQKVSVESCYLCHFKPIKGEETKRAFTSDCKSCHTVPKGIIKRNGVEVNHEDSLTASLECTQCHQVITSGDGSVSTEKCLGCHASRDFIKRFDEIAVIHDVHVAKKHIECFRCHSPIKHKLPSLDEPVSAECVSCHKSYHKESIELYSSFSFKEDENYLSPEFMSHIECKACHLEEMMSSKGTTFIANSQSCIECHYSRFGNFLEEWRNTIAKLITEVKAELTIAKEKVNTSALSAKRKEELNNKLAEASSKIDKVEKGKGVHNIRYSDMLIRQAHDIINGVFEEIGLKAIVSDNIEAYRFASKKECIGCHYGAVLYTGMYGGIAFSHVPHLAKGKVDCVSCHEYVTRWESHGKLKFSGTDGCKKCHNAAKTCQSCHIAFENTLLSVFNRNFIHAPHIDKAQMICKDCHAVESEATPHGKLTLGKAADCSSCHHGAQQTRRCADCHTLQASLEQATIPSLDESMKAIITHKFDCSKCHDMSQKQTRTVIAEKCAGCHDERYVGKIDEAQKLAKDALIEIGNLIKRAQQLELNDTEKEELKRIVERHEYLLRETKPGVHNPLLWKAVIDKDRRSLRNWLGES